MNALLPSYPIAPVAPDQLGTPLDEALLLFEDAEVNKLRLIINKLLPALTWHLEGGVSRIGHGSRLSFASEGIE